MRRGFDGWGASFRAKSAADLLVQRPCRFYLGRSVLRAGATIGAVTKASSGDKTYSYTISARDGTACPVQLPLSSLTAVTVALVRQDEGSCSNENVADNGSGPLFGSVTVARATEESSTAGIRLAGAAPNTSYRDFVKMRPPARDASHR